MTAWLGNLRAAGRRRPVLDVLWNRADRRLSEKGGRVRYPPQSRGQADPHLLSGLNSCDLQSIWYCPGIIISLSSLGICYLPWKGEGLPEDLKNMCSDMIVSLFALILAEIL